MLEKMNLLALFIQVVLPIFVGLVTKRSWPAGVKAVLLLLLTAATQFLTAWQDTPDGTVFNWKTALYSTTIGFVIAVAIHFGLWKPTGVADTAQDLLINDKAKPPARRH